MASYFQSVWLTGNCKNEPSAMYIFSENNPTKAYQFVVEEYAYSTCGNNPKQKFSGCCYSSLNISQSIYQSISHQAINLESSTSKLTLAPKTANGVTYCHLITSNSTVQESFYRPGTACYDGQYKCSYSNQLQIFPEDKCQGNPTTLPLSNQLESKVIPKIGPVSYRTFVFQEGKEVFTWTAYTPSTLLIPDYSVSLEVIENLSFGLANIGAIVTIVYLFLKYYQKRTSYLYWLFVSQIMWFLWIFTHTYYYNVIFPTYQSMLWFSQIKNSLFGLATLATVVNSTTFLLAFHIVKRKSLQFLWYLLVLIVHIILCGGKYFDYFRLQQSSDSFLKQWQDLAIIWIVLLFGYNILPSFYISISILRIDSKHPTVFHVLSDLFKVDKKFLFMMIVQLLITICYFAMSIVQNLTEFFGNDRQWLAINGPITLCFVFHSILNCLFIEHVRVIMGLRTKISTLQNELENSMDGSEVDLQVMEPARTTSGPYKMSYSPNQNSPRPYPNN
ncbi:hypothetical protein HDV02_006492 [Globomyces sp. JEL0801]|nr:hypothetical protein HDV02_006492 [Globomyces sp. JEL0801]